MVRKRKSNRMLRAKPFELGAEYDSANEFKPMVPPVGSTVEQEKEFYRERYRRYTGKWRENNKEKYNAYMREYRAKNHDQALALDAKSQLKRRYGLTPEQFESLLNSQDLSCAICGTTKNGGGAHRMCVDHDHETGNVRGLLCHRCNRALGLFGDSETLLQSAIDYLNGVKNGRT